MVCSYFNKRISEQKKQRHVEKTQTVTISVVVLQNGEKNVSNSDVILIPLI